MTAASSRRSFMRKTGAALSVPLAAAGAVVELRATGEDDPIAARLAGLEDAHAIRTLNQAFAQQVNAGTAHTLGIDPAIGNVVAEDFGARDAIEVALDRQTATGVMHCTVTIETAIGPSCPLVEMAREQGGGVVRRSESGVFEYLYARRDGVWSIERATYRRL
jgi:hypothetical protein